MIHIHSTSLDKYYLEHNYYYLISFSPIFQQSIISVSALIHNIPSQKQCFSQHIAIKKKKNQKNASEYFLLHLNDATTRIYNNNLQHYQYMYRTMTIYFLLLNNVDSFYTVMLVHTVSYEESQFAGQFTESTKILQKFVMSLNAKNITLTRVSFIYNDSKNII